MKNTKFISALFTLVVIALLSSCSTQEDEVILPNIVGTWKSEAVTSTGEEATQDGQTTLIFNSDFTLKTGKMVDGSYVWNDKAGFSIQGSQMFINYEDENGQFHTEKCLFHIEGNTLYLTHFSNNIFPDLTLVRQ